MTLIQKKSKSQPKKKSQNYQRGMVGVGSDRQKQRQVERFHI